MSVAQRRTRAARVCSFALALLGLAACSRGGAPDPSGSPRDLAGRPRDLSGDESEDLAEARDFAGTRVDLAMGGGPDLAVSPRDMASSKPCKRGTGFTAWRFKYDGSTSSRLEEYGLPDSSNWEAVPAYSTSFVDAANGGGINIASGNWILIRFSLEGLTRINSATLSVYGRSYSTGSSGSYRAWSPIYGDISSPTNSVSNAWPYTWTSVDYTANVRVGDSKGLTGIRLYAGPSSSNLVINTVELCIDAI